MHDLVHQLGELFLQAVPTAILVVIFYFILNALFFKPLLHAMAQREQRTAGAQKQAEIARKNAAERVQQYQDALKQARAQVYSEQEAVRKTLLDERSALLKDARAAAAKEVSAAKERIAAEVAATRRELEATVGQLSAEIARRVLQTPPIPGAPVREAR
jgi:F-type H+-transporting ATPase subunit b